MTERRILDGFQERRRLAEAIGALAATKTEAELLAHARDLASQFSAEQLAAAIERHLSNPSSQLRGGLGQLCRLLPPAAIVPRLQATVADRKRTALERMGAVVLLERYLELPVAPALTSDLAGNDDIALQSLMEAIADGQSNRHVQLEYVTQMQEHGSGVAEMVLGLLNRLPPDDQTGIVRLMAQDRRAQVAHAAIERLTSLASTSDAALQALSTLAWTAAPAAVEQIQRALRKLQFMGRRAPMPESTGWRALLGLTDVSGYCNLWLLRAPTEPAQPNGVLVSILFNPTQGIMQCSGAELLKASQLPAPQPLGSATTIRSTQAEPSTMLEIPLPAARWLLQQALSAHWQRAEVDLPGDYKLYNDLVWQFGAGQLSEAHLSIFTDTGSGLEAPNLDPLATAASQLVSHPAMKFWRLWAAKTWSTAAPLAVWKNRRQELVHYLLSELDALPQHTQLLEGMAAALKLQALWLAIHGEAEAAEQASLFSRWMRSLPLPQNPLLVELLNAGLAAHRTPPA